MNNAQDAAALRKKEAELAAKEKQLKELEKKLIETGALKKKNWPRCYPMLHHDIPGEIPEKSRRVVREAYFEWMVSVRGFAAEDATCFTTNLAVHQQHLACPCALLRVACALSSGVHVAVVAANTRNYDGSLLLQLPESSMLSIPFYTSPCPMSCTCAELPCLSVAQRSACTAGFAMQGLCVCLIWNFFCASVMLGEKDAKQKVPSWFLACEFGLAPGQLKPRSNLFKLCVLAVR